MLNKKFLKYINKFLNRKDILELDDIEYLADKIYKPISLTIHECDKILLKLYDILNAAFVSNRIEYDNAVMVICGLIAVQHIIETSPICNNYLVLKYDHCQSLYSSIKDTLVIK